MAFLARKKRSTLVSQFVGKNKFNFTVNTTVVQSDEKILIGGAFSSYAGALNRDRLVRLNSDGTTDTAFCANASDNAKFNSPIRTIAVQSDGKILVGGDFSSYDGTSGRNLLVRLNSDGTTDTAFCANASDGNKFSAGFSVYSISIQTDGKILVSGSFTNYNGTSGRNRLVRLNSDGTTDTAFCANASDGNKFQNLVTSIVFQSNGQIIVGGYYSHYAGTSNRDSLIRLNSNGTLDTAFCVNASDGLKFSGAIFSVAIQSDGKILVGGTFVDYAGTVTRNNIVRINVNGTVDAAFCVNASDGKISSGVFSVAIQLDGKILIGGAFGDYGNQFINRAKLARLNSDGTTDTAFCANASDNGRLSGSNQDVYTLSARSSDGAIMVGGNFSNYKSSIYYSVGCPYFAIINSNGDMK